MGNIDQFVTAITIIYQTAFTPDGIFPKDEWSWAKVNSLNQEKVNLNNHTDTKDYY